MWVVILVVAWGGSISLSLPIFLGIFFVVVLFTFFSKILEVKKKNGSDSVFRIGYPILRIWITTIGLMKFGFGFKQFRIRIESCPLIGLVYVCF